MKTKLIDNVEFRELFYNSIRLLNEEKLLLSAICLTANSGKGKSAFINHFKEYCSNENVETVLIDFAVYSITSEFELINYMYEQLCTVFNNNCFNNYLNELEKTRETVKSKTEIKSINMVNTSIGSVEINNSNTDIISFSAMTNAFFKDVEKLPKKTVFFFDTLEKANDRIVELIKNKIVINKRNDNYFTVIAGQKKIIDDSVASRYRIINHTLPDKYYLKDYIEYAKEIEISSLDPSDLKKIYNCWNGDPFRISIGLEPFRGDLLEKE